MLKFFSDDKSNAIILKTVVVMNILSDFNDCIIMFW